MLLEATAYGDGGPFGPKAREGGFTGIVTGRRDSTPRAGESALGDVLARQRKGGSNAR